MVPSCAEGGVLGVLPGIIGTLQASETIKLILGIGQPLIGRLQMFDALAFRFREMKLRKDPNCPVCGENPTITELIDYEVFCGIPQAKAEEAAEYAAVRELTAAGLKERLDRGDRLTIIDVRDRHEWDIVNLESHGAKLIPLSEIEDRLVEIDSRDEIVLHCKMGGRSAKAAHLLRDRGYDKLWNLRGGILAWADEVDRTAPKY
jgi:adenylyltransferase/sulfurtransferase